MWKKKFILYWFNFKLKISSDNFNCAFINLWNDLFSQILELKQSKKNVSRRRKYWFLWICVQSIDEAVSGDDGPAANVERFRNPGRMQWHWMLYTRQPKFTNERVQRGRRFQSVYDHLFANADRLGFVRLRLVRIQATKHEASAWKTQGCQRCRR